MTADSSERALTAIRRAEVAAGVVQNGFVRSKDLAARYNVSMVTIRADLDELERQNALQRVHGGAVSVDSRSERPFELVATERIEAKRAIAQRCLSIIKPGQAIILDVGTTSAALADALALDHSAHGVTVYTNGLAIASRLENSSHLSVVVTGGLIRPLQHSLVNPLATVIFRQINADIAFVGCNGIDRFRGVTNINVQEAEVKTAMISAARRRILIADSTKIGVVAMAQICPIDSIDQLVTDSDASPTALDDLRQGGLNVDVVS